MAAPHGSWICGMLTNAITKPYTTLVWFCPGWAFQYQNGGKLGMGNGSSHITGMYLSMNTDISYINCCILVLYMYTIYTGTGPSIHRRLQHCCWSKAFRRSKEGLWQGIYLLVYKQEMCALCSAATPSPFTRVRMMKESEGAWGILVWYCMLTLRRIAYRLLTWYSLEGSCFLMCSLQHIYSRNYNVWV